MYSLPVGIYFPQVLCGHALACWSTFWGRFCSPCWIPPHSHLVGVFSVKATVMLKSSLLWPSPSPSSLPLLLPAAELGTGLPTAPAPFFCLFLHKAHTFWTSPDCGEECIFEFGGIQDACKSVCGTTGRSELTAILYLKCLASVLRLWVHSSQPSKRFSRYLRHH